MPPEREGCLAAGPQREATAPEGKAAGCSCRACCVQGHGDLAVSNAVGSSVFNILVGLGLPYCIVLSAKHSTVQVRTAALH